MENGQYYAYSKKIKISIDDKKCECIEYKQYRLPCRHIFCVRQNLGLDLYLETICDELYTKEYNYSNQPTLQNLGIGNDVCPKEQETNQSDRRTSFIQVKARKPKSKEEKMSEAKPLLWRLIELAALQDFDQRIGLLTSIENCWRNDLSNDLSKQMDRLDISSDNQDNLLQVQQDNQAENVSDLEYDSENDHTIEDIIMPPTLKLRGKPSSRLFDVRNKRVKPRTEK